MQVLAICKCIIVNRNHALGNINAGQIVRLKECAVTECQDIGVRVKLDLGQFGFFKRTKAQHFHACRHSQTARSACRHDNQLSAILGEQQTVLGFIPRVVLVHRDLSKIRQRNKTVLANVCHVGRNMQRSQTSMIERVALQRNVFGITEGHALQRENFHKRIVVDIIDAIGQNQFSQFSFCKGVLRNLGQRNSLFKDHACQSAFLEHTSAHGSQRCGKSDFGQIAGSLKCVLLNGCNL